MGVLEEQLDAHLRSNLTDIALNGLYNDWDWLIVVSGLERTGKSDLALWLAKFFESKGYKFDLETNVLLYEPSVSSVLLNLPNHSVVVVDEGGEILFSRESLKRNNVDTIKTLLAMGVKGHVVIVCIPDWHWLDKMVREHRIKTLMRVVSKPKRLSVGGGNIVGRERGYYRFYTRKQVVKSTKKKHPLGAPIFAGRFKAFKDFFPEDWKVYMTKKMAYLENKAVKFKERRARSAYGKVPYQVDKTAFV